MLSLSDEARASGSESKMQALAISENRLSDLTVSCKTFASLLDKLTNAAIKLSSFPIITSMLSRLTHGNTFCITFAFAFFILANFRFTLFLLFCFLFRALEVDGV